MVFQKQRNDEGSYIDVQGKRYDILSCNVTESKEWVQVGTETQEIDGETVEVPVMESRVVINKGWDEYPNIEIAAKAYHLTYDPLSEGKDNAS